MRNKFAIMAVSCMLLAMGLLATACTNSGSEEMSVSNKTQDLTRTEVVDILRNMDFDNALSREIHGFVLKSLEEGRDEYVRIDKLMSNETRSNGQSLFATRLVNLLMEKYVTRSSGAEDMLKEMENSDFIIYWPYSEDWDGKELPTLVAAPDDEDAKEAIGFKVSQNDGEYEEVLVNEDYAMQHPVWVVNIKKEDPNVTYLPVSDKKSEKKYTCKSTRATGDPIYIWKMTRMKVTHQYDGVFNGGSEIDVQVVYPILSGYAAVTTRQRVNFSRKDIRKERWKDVDILLNTNWREEQITNALIITEWDDGSPYTISPSVTYQLEDGTQLTASLDITITDDDDMICQQPIDRAYAFQNSNYSFDGGRVSIVTSLTVEYEQ